MCLKCIAANNLEMAVLEKLVKGLGQIPLQQRIMLWIWNKKGSFEKELKLRFEKKDTNLAMVNGAMAMFPENDDSFKYYLKF